jgi:hypothetical protein
VIASSWVVRLAGRGSRHCSFCGPSTAVAACRHRLHPGPPRYADIPYVAVVGEQDPARLNMIFDDRYLAASNELNLLNTILLAEEG